MKRPKLRAIWKTVAAVMAAVFLLPCALSAAEKSAVRRAKANPNASDEFFESGRIPLITIEITGTNLSQLRRDNRRYVRATVREGTNVFEDVGIHLKGAAGSFRGLDDRPALTLNFNKFGGEKYLYGMDKIALNNSVQDPTYMTEILCGNLFLAADVPTPRGAHARVRLNGRNLGLYVLKEGFDKTFLRRHFKSVKGNLYDGGFLREITEPLERTSGDGPNDRADLKALAKAAQEKDPVKRLEQLGQVLDLERFITYLAIEVMTHDWDGYPLKRNNYRVYHDPATNKIIFLPHGMDQMFWDVNFPIEPGMEGLVARAILNAPEGRRLYLERMSMLLTNLFRVEKFNEQISELQARIRPALAQIEPGLARNHDGAVTDLRNRIRARVSFLEQQRGIVTAKPVTFDANGFAPVTDWQPEPQGEATLEKVMHDDRLSFSIRAPGGEWCTASWRANVALKPGRYRLEAMARTAGVVPFKDEKGEGAGIRLSGENQSRTNKLSGDTGWTKLEHEFNVPSEEAETRLVCELRAGRGEVWFAVRSLKLRRL